MQRPAIVKTVEQKNIGKKCLKNHLKKISIGSWLFQLLVTRILRRENLFWWSRRIIRVTTKPYLFLDM